MIKNLKDILSVFSMAPSLTEPAPPSNPETTPIIRIFSGDYVHQQGVDGMVSFLPQDLSWAGPINRLILQEVGPKLDNYVLENVIAPKSGTIFAAPDDIWAGPRLLFAIVPKWDGGLYDEERVLKACFRNSLLLAEREKMAVISFPALGAGRKDFPMRKAARLIINCIRAHRSHHVKEVRIICKTQDMMDTYQELSTA